MASIFNTFVSTCFILLFTLSTASVIPHFSISRQSDPSASTIYTIRLNLGSDETVDNFIGESDRFLTGESKAESASGDGIFSSRQVGKKFGISLSLPDGTYTVMLYLIDTCKDKNVFSVDVGGRMMEDFNLADKYGCDTPVKATFAAAQVTDGALVVDYEAKEGNAFVSAIEIASSEIAARPPAPSAPRSSPSPAAEARESSAPEPEEDSSPSAPKPKEDSSPIPEPSPSPEVDPSPAAKPEAPEELPSESPAAAAADTTSGGPSGDAKLILDAHNQYRAEVGVPPLKWSDTVANVAKSYAQTLASTNSVEHSKGEYGENLFAGAAGAYGGVDAVNSWGEEKQYFKNGAFPDVSTTGDWADVGHYTAMVWKTTTEVGCGSAEGSGSLKFVCNYNPPGNFRGDTAY